MGFNFEKFVGNSVPKISIRKNGSFGFLGGAAKKFNLLEGEHSVICFYDRTAKVIGLKFTDNKNEEGAIRIVKNVLKEGGADRTMLFFKGKPFLDYHKISHDSTRAFLLTWDEEHQMAMIDLKDGNDDNQEKDDETQDSD